MIDNQSHLDELRHSSAHLLGASILRIYPDAKLTIGPAIENGFYYDVEFKNPITEADLPAIEKMMGKTLTAWDKFESREVTEKEAKDFYKNNPYKRELLDEIVKKGEKITFYKAGMFEDLCRGGHSENPSKEIGAFKLLSLAGAYWRGSEKNPMLSRIYGTAFSTQEELDAYLLMLEEAKKRDHKKLGQQMDLFFFHETAPGMAYWLPSGFVMYDELLSFSKKVHRDFGYTEIATPILNKKDLYETSGHWFHYRDDMFISPMSYLRSDSTEALEGNETFGIKPMNCPNGMNVFAYKTRSYRDLPLRLSETSVLHRFELSGTLNGLFRAREFRQDDAHVFVTSDQVQSEFTSIMKMIDIFYSAFNLSYKLRFGTRPENYMGEAKDWDEAEKSLLAVLEKSGQEFFVAEGEGAFYGPKVDILMKDSLGREWQTGTIQLDYQQPKNFKIHYIDDSGAEITPAVIHRAIYGSFERFLAILIEHFEGKLPLWMMPIQVQILPVSEKFNDFGKKVFNAFKESEIRVDINSSNNTLGNKIREATLQKVPFMCIIGGQEEEASKNGEQIVSVRTRDGKDLGKLEVKEFIKQIQKDIETKH